MFTTQQGYVKAKWKIKNTIKNNTYYEFNFQQLRLLLSVMPLIWALQIKQQVVEAETQLTGKVQFGLIVLINAIIIMV